MLGSHEEIALSPANGAAELQIDGVPSGTPAANRVALSLLDLPPRPDQLLELVPAELRPRPADP